MFTLDEKVEAIIGSDYPTKVVPLLESAKQTIDIMMYEWKWYTHEAAGGMEKLNLVIQRKAREKIRIRVLLNIESMGHAITKINGRTASFLQKAAVICKFGQVGIATHAKMVIIDQNIVVVGSHNYSKGSFSRNQEVSVGIKGSEIVRPFIDYFNLLWSRF